MKLAAFYMNEQKATECCMDEQKGTERRNVHTR